jgi:hypothetical protein
MSIPFTGTMMYLQHEKGIAKHVMSEYLQAYAKKDVVDIIQFSHGNMKENLNLRVKCMMLFHHK